MRIDLDEFERRVRSLSPQELGYIAGIIDGEGCITARNDPGIRDGRKWWGYVAITNTDPRMLLWIQQRVGGVINDQRNDRTIAKNGKPHKRCYTLRFPMRQAERLLLVIGPLLVVKRDQAELFCAFLSLLGKANGPRKLTDEQMGARNVIISQLHDLKRMEYPHGTQ